MSLFKKTYGSNIKYHHARRGKEAVFEEKFGDDEKSYSDLNWYVKATEKTNPDSYVKFEVDQATGRFQRIFICFSACKHSYRYLRPMIYLDATFLTGRFRGTLMAATCINGNDGFYPFSFVLVSAENKDNWFWFLDNLKQVVDRRPIVFLGDANFKAAIDLFYKDGYSYTSANFEEALRGMHAIGCGHVANYLRTIPNLKVMKKNSERRVEGLENFITRITPIYEAILKENIDIGRTWTVVESMERLWRVNGFPCTHACAAIQATREDIYSFVEPYFTTEWYNNTYQEIIFPIPNYDKLQSYDPSDRVIVPIPVPPPGRRRAQRFKNAWEKQNRPMMCTKCFTLGHHNRATFPMI
ncbi:uncharacterized protein LOC113305981 [Papaver somniferum]|uniref:uncharacterized protein LOC113305981 n=1 Tax=Papaver somniferum TaxID=3469 RepID=UPI000E705070|nr:uncharacterized protein LOC113305981 [Papaver somniferum]